MIKAIVVMLIVVNAIRLVAGAVDYEVPSLSAVIPALQNPPTIETDLGLINAIGNFLITIARMLAFLVDMVAALFIVPAWLLSLPGVPIEIKSSIITPLMFGYGFIGYRLIRRG